jgi:hypothetical protein
MPNDLYFIPILADALQKPEPKMGTRQALEKIEKLGRQPEYKLGFLQFQRFMAEVKRSWETSTLVPKDGTPKVVLDLGLQLASGLLEGDLKETRDLLDMVTSRPQWKNALEKLRLEISKSDARDRISEIVVEKNGERITSISLEGLPITKVIKNVKSGRYEFRLDTGRVIWEETLTERELIWAYAFPDKDLDLAAATGEAVPHPTREISLWNGEVTIRVFPEIESGHLVVEIKD